MKTVFNKGWVAWAVGLAALPLSATDLRGQASAQPNTSIVMFRDGADWVQAKRSPGGGAELTAISLRIRGRTGQASVGKRAVVQLSAAEDRRAAAFFRAQRVTAVSSQAHPQPVAATAERSLAGERAATLRPVALNARLHFYLVESTDAREDGLSLAARLSNVRGIEAAIPDLYYERRFMDFELPPNDPRYAGQWYLKKLGIERAWRVAVGDPGTTIVVIDDGCDLQHPDLQAAMLGGLDALDGDDDPSYTPDIAGNEHGTACAGIIAAVGDNRVGITGVCPTCTLRCVRLFDRSHALIPVSADLRAFDFAFDSGAAVVSNSWGFSEPQPVPNLVRKAIVELLDSGRGGKGALVVFAAGNENREIDNEEIAAIPGVLNVGAVNNYDEAAPFSNYGSSLSVTAPTGTLTTDISGPDGLDKSDYTSLFGGTSSACPVVAGVAALLVSAVPDRTGREIGDALIASARAAPFATPDAQGHDALYGHGIVDPSAALIALGVDVPEVPKPVRDAGADAADSGKPDRASDDKNDGCGCNVPGGDRETPVDTWPLGAALALAAGLRIARRRARRRP